MRIFSLAHKIERVNSIPYVTRSQEPKNKLSLAA